MLQAAAQSEQQFIQAKNELLTASKGNSFVTSTTPANNTMQNQVKQPNVAKSSGDGSNTVLAALNNEDYSNSSVT